MARASTQSDKDKAAAHDYYVSRVHTAIGTCIGCHAGGAGPHASWRRTPRSRTTTLEKTAGLIAAPKNSPLVQYVHKDPAITISPEQRSVITQWLSLEAHGAQARRRRREAEDADGRVQAVRRLHELRRLERTTAWATSRSRRPTPKGPCLGCHSTGQGSAWLSAGSRETFEKARQFPFIQKLVVGKLDDKGSFENAPALEPPHREGERGLSAGVEVVPSEVRACRRTSRDCDQAATSTRHCRTSRPEPARTASSCRRMPAPKDAGDGG